MCLLQRRRMRSEMVDGQGNFNRMPVLLKIWGCDEAVHRRKVELAGEVCDTPFPTHLFMLSSPSTVLLQFLTEFSGSNVCEYSLTAAIAHTSLA